MGQTRPRDGEVVLAGGAEGGASRTAARSGRTSTWACTATRRCVRSLDRRFAEREFAWRPYLHRLLDHGAASEEEEPAAIEAGTIQPVGFRYVGTPATGRESSSPSER